MMDIKNIDIQEIVERLKAIDLKELRNIDASQIKDVLRRRPDVIINTVLIVVALAATLNAVKGYGRKSQTLDWEIKKMKERVDALGESKRLQKEYDAFMRDFPQSILTDQLISKLSEFAANRRVQIISFSPEKERGDEYIKVAKVRIDVITDHYRDLVLFMKDIEDAPYTMRVEKWAGKMKEEIPLKRGKGSAGVKEIVGASIEIGSIELKD